METPKAYLCFDYEHDSSEKSQFVIDSKNSRIPFRIDYESMEPTLPPVQWSDVTRDKITNVNMMIVLIGKKTAAAKWIVKEIRLSGGCNIPVFGVYLKSADPTTELPEELAENRVVALDWNDIAAKIEQVMKEGKNELLWSN